MDLHSHGGGAASNRQQAVSPTAGEAHSSLVPPTMPSGLEDLRLLAINHHGTSLAGFERAALSRDEFARLHARLESNGLGAVVLSTCNRIELYWRSLGPESDAVTDAVFREFTGGVNEPAVVLRACGHPVAHHLFRVTCGLDSLLLGEGEIMGQVHEALHTSGAGDLVAVVFRAALRCGGLARAETAIGAGALSVASAGARLVAEAIGNIERPRIVIVGAGATGTKAARYLRAVGLTQLIIVNRTLERAEAVASRFGAEAAPLDALPGVLRDADAVIVAAYAPMFLITESMVREAMAARPQRGLVVSDLSLPHAVDPALRSLPGVTLHDMHSLESLVHENRTRREREIPRVEAVIQRELAQLLSWAHQQLLRPMMSEFRQRAEAIRVAELRRIAGEDLTDAGVIDRLTRRLVDRLATIPIATIREAHPKTFEACGMQCLRRQAAESGDGSG